MTDAIILVLIWTLIIVNSRREIWKYRAKVRQTQIDDLKRRVSLEQDANKELVSQIPGAMTLYRPTLEWPEDIDA